MADSSTVPEKNTPELIEDAALENVAGGLLLPAVQKIREAAARIQVSTAVEADGSV